MKSQNINSTKRLKFLDSLRGIAAIIVAYHHIFKFSPGYFEEKFGHKGYEVFNFISDLNGIAIVFFFVLSGFSIGLSLKGKDLRKTEVLNTYIYIED